MQRPTPSPISMTLPMVILLLALFATTCVQAQQTTQPNTPQVGKIFTGNEAPLCFDTQLNQHKAVESYPILQFLGARCAEITNIPPPEAQSPPEEYKYAKAKSPWVTKLLFRYKDVHQHYPEYQRLPFDVYFQPKGEPLEELYYINTGSAAYHITLPMRYEGTYYVVIRDQTKPAVLIVNSVTQKAEFRLCCALTESIIPKYLNRQ